MRVWSRESCDQQREHEGIQQMTVKNIDSHKVSEFVVMTEHVRAEPELVLQM